MGKNLEKRLARDGFSARLSKTKNIAEVIIFLMSDASKVISGAAVPVYGKA